MEETEMHFFNKNDNEDTETIDIFSENQQKETPDFNESLYKRELTNLIKKNLKGETDFEIELINEYSRSIGFLCAVLKDKKFNILTPPNSLFQKSGMISFKIEFYGDAFIIKDHTNTRTRSFEYSDKTFEMLESIQKGRLSIEIINILTSLTVKQWLDGKVIISVEDYRLNPMKEYLLVLEIDASIFKNFVNSQNLEQEHQRALERKLILMKNPVICTDPSTDVSRVKSLLDYNRKMWCSKQEKKTENIEENVSKPAEKENTAKEVKTINKINVATKNKSINIPSHILKLFAPPSMPTEKKE